MAKQRVIYKRTDDNDAIELAQNLRAADLAEMQAQHGYGVDPLAIIRMSIEVSGTECKTAIDSSNGKVLAVFGTAESRNYGFGVPWLLAAEGTDKYAKELLVWGREYVAAMVYEFGFLCNYVDANNRRSVRWLQRIGFTVHAPEPHGVYCLPFHPFSAG